MKVRQERIAAGYILRGDMASAEDNGGVAASYYEMSTQPRPAGTLSAYVKYARVYRERLTPHGAVAILPRSSASVKPDYPVDAAAGYMYSSNNQLKTAIQLLRQSFRTSTRLEDYILFDYASTAYVLEDYDKTLQLAAAGVEV